MHKQPHLDCHSNQYIQIAISSRYYHNWSSLQIDCKRDNMLMDYRKHTTYTYLNYDGLTNCGRWKMQNCLMGIKPQSTR